MDFELSDDQRALQDAAADLLGSLSTTEQVLEERRRGDVGADLLGQHRR
ncbi:MAG: hypothetical protein JOZ04_14285, partial [Acidimicrobiia bacterium]|nr:hypothetical protein [Acidimicrobiia bacterium]